MIRYPGGKAKLCKQIIAKIDSNLEYREPFFGGGSIGLKVNAKKIWINDLDAGIASLWTSVINYPNELKELIVNFTPSVDKFDEFKKELLQNKPSNVIDFGFKKLVLHQISYSGLGTKSGGPLGGREQKSKYPIDCRWSPRYLCKKIDAAHAKFKNTCVKYDACTQLDFSKLIDDPEDAFIYLDPPYYVKGNELYQCGFTKNDHERLADCLKKTNHKWALSYDDCSEIRELYNWANIEEIAATYTINSSRKKNELLICKPSLCVGEIV